MYLVRCSIDLFLRRVCAVPAGASAASGASVKVEELLDPAALSVSERAGEAVDLRQAIARVAADRIGGSSAHASARASEQPLVTVEEALASAKRTSLSEAKLSGCYSYATACEAGSACDMYAPADGLRLLLLQNVLWLEYLQGDAVNRPASLKALEGLLERAIDNLLFFFQRRPNEALFSQASSAASSGPWREALMAALGSILSLFSISDLY